MATLNLTRSSAEAPSPKPTTKAGFRDDVQGLRAIAVLLVVAYHSGLGVTGGFIGVDVFFVISGFVIGRTLINELDDSGRLDLPRFYSKRIRRLLPALAVVTTITMLVSIPITEFHLQGWTAATGRAATLFLANVFLYRSGGGYFDPDDELNALLHTWSLSVEEQFYFVLPVALFVLWFVARRSPRLVAGIVLGLVGVFSLYLCWTLTSESGAIAESVDGSRRFAFYLSFTRIWEFLAGVALAMYLRSDRSSRRYGNGLWIIGAAAVVLAAVGFDELTPFPGIAAAAPVVGAAAMIGSGADTVGAQLLRWRPLTWIGDLSYSWYLWHWPAIVFALHVFPGVDFALPLAAIGSIGLAWLTYRFVETKLRFGLPSGWRVTAGLLAACIVVPLATAQVIRAGARQQWGSGIEVIELVRTPHWADCHNKEDFVPWDRDACTWADPELESGAVSAPAPAIDGLETTGGGRSVFLVGDSHAIAISQTLHEAADANDLDLQVWSSAGCPFSSAPRPIPGCATYQEAVLETILAERPAVVFVANRSPLYTLAPNGERERFHTVADVDGSRPQSEEAALPIWERGLDDNLQVLTEAGIRVLIMSTVPAYEINGPGMQSFIHPEGIKTTRTRSETEERGAGTRAIELALAERYDLVSIVDTLDVLCTDICDPTRDGEWIYNDDDHVNLVGASLLEERLTTALAASVGRN